MCCWRRWAAAQYVDDRTAGADPTLQFTSWNMFEAFSHFRVSVPLVPRDRSFATFTDQASVRGGSTAYFRVSGASRPATALRVRTATEALLPSTTQVWIVRLQ